MMHLSSSSYQLSCLDCQWRSHIHHENAKATLTTCPICDQSNLQAQAVHMLDWLFEQAMHTDSSAVVETESEAINCSAVA